MLRRLIVLLALGFPLFAQNATLPPYIHNQYLDKNGKPLTGGKLYTCQVHTTCPGNPEATFTDSTATVENANPVILDYTGFASIYLKAQTHYKIAAYDRNNVLQWTQDDIVDNPDFTDPINVLTLGLVNDGTFDNTNAISAAFALNKPLYFPAGDYKIAGQWAVNAYSNTVTFDAKARLLFVQPTDHASTLLLIQDSFGARFNGMQIDYTESMDGHCTYTGGYCGTTLAIQNSGNLTFNNLKIKQAQAIALIAANVDNLTMNDTYIGLSAGTIFNGDLNLQLNGFTCPDGTTDDCLNITSQSAPVGGKVGAAVNGLYSLNSAARGLYIGTAEIDVTNFNIIGAEDDGITIENASAGAQTDPPARISIANGTIRVVRDNGTATSPSASKSCIYIQSDKVSNNTGNIDITNLHCVAPDGAGIASFKNASGILDTNLTVSNTTIEKAGNGTDPDLEGSCFHLLDLRSFSGTNNVCDTAKGVGYYVDGNALGVATITGGLIRNANTIQAAGKAIWMHSVPWFTVSGVTVIDDRSPSMSYIVAADNTARAGTFSNILFDVITPGSTHFPTLSTDGTTNVFTNIQPAVILANIAGANGTSIYCADCDTPASQGATCSASGDHAGAQMTIARGVKKCY